MKKKEDMVKNKSRRNRKKLDSGVVSRLPSELKAKNKKRTLRYIRKVGFGPAQGWGE